MSAKTKRVERSQRFRRAWRGQNRKKAVSPVVATLILILIAVAAAAALYLWLVVWQGNITGGIGTQHAEPTLQIGGSTSVYPFSSLAVSWFEQNNTDTVISDNQGGTGAGMIALCEGNIDLGASSTPQTVATLEASYGCASTYASTITITTIAYDAVDVVVAGTNPHGLLSLSADTLNVIYEASSTSKPADFIGTVNGFTAAEIQAGGGSAAFVPSSATWPTAGDPGIAWEQIPAFTALGSAGFVSATVTTAVTLSDSAVDAKGVTTTAADFVACGVAVTSGTQTYPDLCDAGLIGGAAATGTPCGFPVCAGGAASGSDVATATIVPVERSDASGTTQTFEAKLLGYGIGSGSSATEFASTQDGTSFSNLGYGGCGSNNLLSDCGFAYPTGQQGNGNPGVLSIVAGNLNAVGYASDGLARTTTGIGASGIIPFLGLGQGISGAGLPVTTQGSTYSYGGVVPTTGTSGTIAAGLTASATVNQYVGGRPFELISLEPLTGVAQEFVTFITDPANNAALASATDEVGLYQVV